MYSKKSFFGQKLKFAYPGKGAQTTGEAFSPQKRTSNTSKYEIFKFFLLLWVNFALLDPDPDFESGNRSIDLIESGSNPNPDPKHTAIR